LYNLNKYCTRATVATFANISVGGMDMDQISTAGFSLWALGN